MGEKTNILYLVTHPIQYQAPLLKLISQSENLHVHTIFYWDQGQLSQTDAGFGQAIKWDIPLLDGYPFEFLSQQKKNIFSKLFFLWKKIDAKQYDIVWTHGYADAYTLPAILFAKLKGMRVFVRGDSALFPDSNRSFFRTIKRKIFFRFLNIFVDRYLAVGENNKNFYLLFGVPQKKIGFCSYTVDNTFFRNHFLKIRHQVNELKSSLGLEPDRSVILYAGKFITRKYPIDLLSAYKLLCQNTQLKLPYLLFIGIGETYNAVKEDAEIYPDTVRFLGFKNQSELPYFFAISDIFVLPAIHENYGLIVNEVMNAECALVLTDHIACADDLLKHGENGFVYPARDTKKLADYLQRLVENPLLCEKMKTASAHIISQWGLAESVAGLEAACNE